MRNEEGGANEKLEMGARGDGGEGRLKKMRKTSHEFLRTFNVIFPNFS